MNLKISYLEILNTHFGSNRTDKIVYSGQQKIWLLSSKQKSFVVPTKFCFDKSSSVRTIQFLLPGQQPNSLKP